MRMPTTLATLFAPASQRVTDASFLLLRVAAGLIMIPHGWPKLFGTFAPVLAKNVLTPLGLPFPLAVAYGLGTLEIVGGLALAAGFMTRPLALAFAIEMAVITAIVNWPKGWIYSVPGGGAEFPALLLVVYVVLLFAGPGRMAADAGLARRADWRS